MNNVQIVPFSTDEALAEAAARDWIDAVQKAPRQTPFLVALSGGRIARRFSAAAAKLATPQPSVFEPVHFFWGDERCVPPTDPESNYAIARDLLFTPLNIPERQIHRIRGEATPEHAAAEAEAELRRLAPLGPGTQPVFDLIFLGMGEDGHVASLFPEEAESARASRAVYRPVTASKPPPQRITLGYPAIVAAREVWVLASGGGKQEALRRSLEPSGDTPLARVLRSRTNTRVLTDIPLEKISI